ncbi:hypothetical protein [Burkholderia multivorans]|uniref:hypothetical protein n=1 Tax=Burkholderia multivorans TaxID=87883 RepID=UPI00285C2A06|nr:hypothetical protein [Burkholderia multivorans]MDR9060191.1 hypothetical protein [Burkholderia multivorans]MDR9064075.1 hypothetical protein [Burkholderia multivorans]MDR9082758.1 hypothetical protein [Burkholderia multivorans]MDR9091861.1 hypothetical protein [Burkholderia multivorans]MDR9101206.1 hypothetical protein [Burkholderia multivorans]
MGALFFAKGPGRMAFVMRDQVKVGGCVWQHTAATGISKGMILNGIFAGIWQNRPVKETRNQYVGILVDK